MEERYTNLRKQLEDLGYHQYLKIECVPLVEKLVSDLVQTTESLRKYMTISKDAITERDNLLLGAEPYKCDNAKLVRECNELHLAFLQFREQHEKLQKDLKKRIAALEKQKIDGDLEREKLLTDIKKLEVELAYKANRQINRESVKLGIKPSLKTSSMSTLPKCRCGVIKEKMTTIALAEEKISNLTKEIGKLKEDKLGLAEANLAYKNQINSRDKEIQRLTSFLEGGRPIQALNQDCCYKDVEVKVIRMQDEIDMLQRSKKDLENRLKEAVIKQHEAMKRALTLAERNRVLEKEMREIDQIALAVEAECNSSSKSNANKVSRLQERVHESVLQIQQLEKEVADFKRDKQELISDYEVVKTEKRHLQTALETALEEKKRLNERLNQYTIIEHDLNLEIDRLMQNSAAQKQRIADLECRLMSTSDRTIEQALTSKRRPIVKPVTSPLKNSHHQKRKPNKTSKRKSPISKDLGLDNTRPPYNTPASPTDSWHSSMRGRNVSPARSPTGRPSVRRHDCHNPKSCVQELKRIIQEEIHNKDVCLNHLKELIGNEIDHIQSRANMSLEHLKNERDYYMKECQNLMEKMRSLCNGNQPTDVPKITTDNDRDFSKKLAEKEHLIATLEHENRTLSQEKHNLMTRLETARDRGDHEMDALSARSITKRMERERDLLKGDIQRLEEERDELRQRLSTITEHHSQEKARLEVILRDAQEDIGKLEADRREYIHTQGSRKAIINNLQEEADMLREQLRTCQSEFNQQRAYHSQLKTLHEQTDKALADCQSQLHQVEKEMFKVQERLKSCENEKDMADKEIINLRNDLTVMKGSFAKMDMEKDSLLQNLDDKTEKIAALEEDLKKREVKITHMEATLADMRRKISETSTEFCAKEQLLRNTTADLTKIEHDLEAALRARDMAYQENRRLQDDLASCTADNKRTHTELEIAKRQVDDLKRQLQHYVAEVKRTEDLISNKEIERSEMLDQFRSLTHEATVLENNNHSLETEAAETKLQLSVALDHVADLERKIDTQETMIRDYEKQISDLTAQIARLEFQLVQQTATGDKLEAELASMKELCVKLDKQKDTLMKQLQDREAAKQAIDRDLEKLRRDSAHIESNLAKERESVEHLEVLLAESRQNTVEQRLLNQELQQEVDKLKERVRELDSKLITTTEHLDLYQQKALDYSQQNKQLRREIANERFGRAREDESKRYPSLLTLPDNGQVNNAQMLKQTKDGNSNASALRLHKANSHSKNVYISGRPDGLRSSVTSKNGQRPQTSSNSLDSDRNKRDSAKGRESSCQKIKSASFNLDSKTPDRNGNNMIAADDRKQFENKTGIEAYNQKVDSMSRDSGSKASDHYNQTLSRKAIREMLPNNENEGSLSLVEIARNPTVPTIDSTVPQPLLSRNAQLSSSSSSDEIVVHNPHSSAAYGEMNAKAKTHSFTHNENASKDDRPNAKNGRRNSKSEINTAKDGIFSSEDCKFISQNGKTTSSIETIERKRFPSSISANPINTVYDASCPVSSYLGIVSNENKLMGRSIGKVPSEEELPHRKKRVSLPAPPDGILFDSITVQQTHYDSISAALPSCSIGTGSLGNDGAQVTETQVSRMLTSASKYVVDSKLEEEQQDGRDGQSSRLGLVSQSCALPNFATPSMLGRYGYVDAGTDPRKIDIAPLLKDINYENKSSQSEACECWKICTCNKSRLNDITCGYINPLILNPCDQGHQTITCVITNSNATPRNYTASYSFKYDDAAPTQGSKT